MRKSKIELLYKYLILFIFLLSILYVFFCNKSYKLYKFNGTDEGVITNIYNGMVNQKLLIKSNKYKYYAYVDKKISKDLKFGDRILFDFKYKEIDTYKIFNIFNFNNYLKSQEISSVIAINNIRIKSNHNNKYLIKNKIIRIIDNKKSSRYIKAFLFCDKSFIDKDVMDSYYNNGIMHLLCVSGFHILFLLSLIKKILRYIFSSNTFINLLLFIFSCIYLFNTDFNISFLRAFLFYFLCTINSDFNINIKNIYILIFVLSLSLFLKPLAIFSSGFWYSYILSFGLVIYAYKIQKYKLIRISFLCFLLSMPLLIYFNYEINFCSILFSILFSFFISYLIYPFCFITLAIPFFDRLFNVFIKLFENINIYLNNNISLKIIFSKINIFMVIFIYLFLFLFLIFNKKKYIFLYFIFILYVYFISVYHFNNKVYFLDVHQGDMSLVLVNKKSLLIDTGGDIYNSKYLIKNYISFFHSIGLKKINYLIITHGDYDHMGEAINLVNNFKVEKVIFNCGEYNDLEKELIKILDKKKIPYYSCIKELNIDKNKLYFLQTKEYDNENDNSNVIYTELNGYKFMFMGDAGIDKEKDILDKYSISDIDVLKVGHHGSKTSSSEDFINNINPKYSIISVGKNNRYDHPNKEVLNTLEDSKIYRTDKVGSIMFKIKNNKLRIKTCDP